MPEMPRLALDTVHGMSVDTLAKMVTDAWPDCGQPLVIEPYSMGGWSNLNIPAWCGDQRLVLKLPVLTAGLVEHPYEYVVRVSSHLAGLGLCPRPVVHGVLDNDHQTPFTLFEYVPGETRSSVASISHSDMECLETALATFSAQSPAGVNVYPRPSDFVRDRTCLLERLVQYVPGAPSHVLEMIPQFLDECRALVPSVNSCCPWSGRLMHGDLQESNIVFTGRRAVLLDLEYCALGEPLLDTVYLVLQSPDPPPPDRLPAPLRRAVEDESLVPLSAVALVAAVAWTVERLLLIHVGAVMPQFSSSALVSAMEQYVRDKMSQFRDVLSSL